MTVTSRLPTEKPRAVASDMTWRSSILLSASFQRDIGIGKVRADIAERERPQDGVGHSVRQDIGVGMAFEAALVRDDDAAQHQAAAGDERMHDRSRCRFARRSVNTLPARALM